MLLGVNFASLLRIVCSDNAKPLQFSECQKLRTCLLFCIAIRSQSEDNGIVDIERSDSSHCLDAVILIFVKVIEANAVKFFIHDRMQLILQYSVQSLCHLTFEHRVLHPLTVVFADTSHLSETFLTFLAGRVNVVCH